MRPLVRTRWADSTARDLRYALRRLRATPAFTIFAIASLALGIGLTTAVYTVIHSMLWRSLDIRAPEEVVDIVTPGIGFARIHGISLPDLADLRAQQTSLSGVAASRYFQTALASAGCVETVYGELVSGDYFGTLGVVTRIGRTIQPADDRPGAPPVVVLSEALWKDKCGANPDVVGRIVKLGGRAFEIIGVTRGSFSGPFMAGPASAVWIPLSAAPLLSGAALAIANGDDRAQRVLSVKGRLKPGRIITEAAAELALIARRLDLAFPANRPGVAPRSWSAVANAEGPLLPLPGLGALVVFTVGLILLIACTNLANLSLARGSSRQHDFAVRAALGASRARIVREQLTESAIVAVSGSILGLLVARAFIAWLAILFPAMPADVLFRIESAFSLQAFGMAAAAAGVSLLVCGLWPALQLTEPRMRSPLRSGAGATPLQWKQQRSLLVWQVFGSVALFLIAAFIIKQVGSTASPDLGIDIDRLAVAQIDFQLNGRDEAQARRSVDNVLTLVREQPGIETVAASVGLPFGTNRLMTNVQVTLNQRFIDGITDQSTYVVASSPEIFRTLGVSIVNGRAFDGREGAGPSRVAVVSEHFAREIFGTVNVTGRTFLSRARGRSTGAAFPAESITVIGVASDTAVYLAGRPANNLIYRPFEQYYEPSIVIVARAARDPGVALATLRAAIRQVDPELAVSVSGTGPAVLLGPVGVLRTVGVLAGMLGALALALAMTGLYGVLSHVVERRTRELGIRMALGADRPHIQRMILMDGFRPVLDGLVLGIVASTGARLAIRPFIPNPPPLSLSLLDPVSLSLVALAVTLAAFLACHIPARRATSVHPSVALRDL